MENMVRATLISNAGLLLEYRGVKLLVDAIYHTTDPFSNPPPAVWSAMLAGEPPFDGVDTLLFTHDHPDHFSPERLMQYLRYRTVRQVVLPVRAENSVDSVYSTEADGGLSNSGRDRHSTLFYPAY